MSLFGDILDFETHNFGNIWDQIKKNPERLLYGSVDPFSTELWNQITGSDHEPMVNMLGGPQGSGWAGLGENGGVYKSAQNEGIDTEWSEKSHDVAEIIASIYGGQGAYSGLGNAFGGGASAGGGYSANPADLQALEAADASALMNGGGVVNPDMGFGSPAAGFNWMDMLDELPNSSGNNQQQAQQTRRRSRMRLTDPEFQQAYVYPYDTWETDQMRRDRRMRG